MGGWGPAGIERVRGVTWFGMVGLRVIRGVSGLGSEFVTRVHGHPGHRSTLYPHLPPSLFTLTRTHIHTHVDVR